MTALKVRGEIDADGKLRLEIPVGLPAGMAEVLVVVQPDPPNAVPQTHASARSGLFLDLPPIDIDAAIDEMNAAWKSKLDDIL